MVHIVDRKLEMQYMGSDSMFQTIVNQAKNPSPLIKVKTVAPGSVLKGAIEAGMVEAFHQADVIDGIDEAYCHSSGGFVSLAMVERAVNTRKTFYEFCVNTNLIAPRRHPIDLKALEGEFDTQIPTYSQRRTRLKVVLGDMENDGVVVIDPAETNEHPLKTVVRSTTWPYGITNTPLERDEENRLLGDGGLVAPIPYQVVLDPIRQAAVDSRPIEKTYVLVLSPFTPDERLPEIDKLYPFSSLIKSGRLPKPAELLLQMPARFNKDQEEIYAYATGEKQIPDVEFGIIAPTKKLDGFQLHSSNLRRAQIKARIFTSDLFRKYTH